VVRRERDRDRRIDAGQLLDDDRVGERVAARPAVFLRNRHSHQPELRELGGQLVRKPRLAIELLGDGRDLLEREPANGVANQFVFRVEVEVHGAKLAASSTINRTP
jgi:hypothetical protein